MSCISLLLRSCSRCNHPTCVAERPASWEPPIQAAYLNSGGQTTFRSARALAGSAACRRRVISPTMTSLCRVTTAAAFIAERPPVVTALAPHQPTSAGPASVTLPSSWRRVSIGEPARLFSTHCETSSASCVASEPGTLLSAGISRSIVEPSMAKPSHCARLVTWSAVTSMQMPVRLPEQ
jgi:hypothetical protein